MTYELTSFTGAIRERHPTIKSAVERVAQVFNDCDVTTDDHRIWVDGQLYGWVHPLSKGA